MNWLTRYVSSSVGRKTIMALTGLSLVLFVLVHLLGNITMLMGESSFNHYSHAIVSNKLIYVAEIMLVFIAITHVFLGLTLALENLKARPVRYHAVVHKSASISSKLMPITGILLLIFIVMHLINFKYGASVGEVEGMRNIYQDVLNYFKSPLNLALYISFMVMLGLHTGHGLWSSLQTLGVNHTKYSGVFYKVSVGFGLLVTVGFSFFAVFAFLQN